LLNILGRNFLAEVFTIDTIDTQDNTVDNTVLPNNKSPYRPLLLIPITLIVTIVLLAIGAYIDNNLISWGSANAGQGHPVPFITLLVALVMTAANVLVGIVAIIVTIYNLYKRR